MPALTNMSTATERKSLIVYGPPFSGKTTLAAQVAKKFKVLYIGGENSASVLLKLPPEYQKNIFVQHVHDTKDTPNFIKTGLLLASGIKTSVCDKHGIAMNNKPTIMPCVECLQAARALELAKQDPATLINTWTLNDMKPNEWVIIFDSLTQLSSSANAHVTRGLKGEMDFEEFKHWRAQGTMLEKFLDYIQAGRYNVVVISHEEGIKQEDGSEKIVPAGGTSNFARKIAKNFDGAAYCFTRNKKHVVYSKTTDDSRIIAGTRNDVEIISGDADSICKFFGK